MQEHDHLSETTGSPTTTPRGEHVDASAPSRSQRQKFRLFKPGDFDTYPPGKAAQYAMRAYARALATVGKAPSDKGRKQVGAWFKTMLEKGQTHERTWELFRQYVDSGVAGGDYSWLVDNPRPAPEPDPDDFVAYITMREEVEEWKVGTFGEEFTDAEASSALGMYGADEPMEKIRRTLKARIRKDQDDASAERSETKSLGVYSVACDDCEATVGRWCRNDVGKPMIRVCHPWRFKEAGVQPANRAS